MTSVGQVVDSMREITGLPIVSLDKPVTGPHEFRADISTLQRLIDWQPRISIEEGIRRTWEFEKARRAG